MKRNEMKTQTKLNRQISPTDCTSLESAFFRTWEGGIKHSIDVWEDGFGPLWLMRDSMGIVGIIRAQTWEDAYACAIDELLPDGEMPPEEFATEHEQACWEEANSWRGNGVPANNRCHLPVAAHDINGEALEALTPALMRELGIRIQLKRF